MADLVRLSLAGEEPVVVDVDGPGNSIDYVGRRDGAVDIDEQFTRRLSGVREAVDAALHTLRDGLTPSQTQVTFPDRAGGGDAPWAWCGETPRGPELDGTDCDRGAGAGSLSSRGKL